MNKREAKHLLAREMAALRQLSYEELRSRIPPTPRRVLFVEVVNEPQVESYQVTGESGTLYQVATQVFWDGKSGEDIRVMGSIDDGGLSSFKPMTDDFIMAPDGRFVDE
jgi:hypothetical protein